MAVRVLGFARQLRSTHAERRDVEQRVVAETVVAAGRLHDFAVPAAHRHQRLGIVGAAQRDQRADEARTAVGHAPQALQQQAVVGGVLAAPPFFASGQVAILHSGQFGKMGRRHTRRAAERIDAQTRVVGDRRAAGSMRRVARLGQRVFDKGVVRLFGLFNPQAALRHQLEPERREQSVQLGQLG